MTRVVLTIIVGLLAAVPVAVRADAIPERANELRAADEPAISAAEFARALLDETNRVRREQGRRALRARRELTAAADDQAAFMALRMHVEHDSFLRGQATPWDRVQRRGLFVESGAVAENVASTSLGNKVEEFSAEKIAAELVRQWMNSPGHRATLLDPNITHFGGAVRLAKTIGGGWAAYGAQVFLVERPRFGRVSGRGGR